MSGKDIFEIREIGPDEKITEPGFYRIPMAQHHGQPCDGISVTSSVLRKMELQTPADVWEFHQLNKDRWESDDSDALRMGRAMAALIEGGSEELERHFIVLPKNKPNKPTEGQMTAYRNGKGTEAGIRSVEFWAEVNKDPRDIVTETEWALMCDMGKVLAKDPAASAALGGQPEITMAWYDDLSDLWCLARPDQVEFSGMISDYKKVNTQGRPFNHSVCDNRTTQHGYDMQMAFACEGFNALTDEWPGQVGLVFQTDKRPHHVILRGMEDEDISIGMFRNRRARMRFRECYDLGHWPGPGEDIGTYRRPEWQREKLLEEMNTAGTAP